MPEIGIRRSEFNTDFTLAFVYFADADHAAGLLFTRFGIAKDKGLADANVHREMDKTAMSIHYSGECLLGDGLFVGTNRDDENAHAKQNALTAASIAHGSEIGRERAHSKLANLTYGSEGSGSQR